MKIPLFDIDGTLFKTGDSTHRDSTNFALKKVYNQSPRNNEIIPHGMTDKQILVETLRTRGINPEITRKKIKTAMQIMVEYFDDNRESVKPEILPGVKNLLKALKNQNITIGLLTGNVEGVAWTRIERAGLMDFFEFGAFGDKTEVRSELVEIARKNAEIVLKKTVNKNELVIIGDTPRDIQCARDTGIKVIIVSTGKFSYEDLEKEKPDLLLHSLEDKGKVLEFLNNN